MGGVADDNGNQINITMSRIRKVLLDRYNLREDARALLEKTSVVELLAEQDGSVSTVVTLGLFRHY
jgi:hypothetical protein